MVTTSENEASDSPVTFAILVNGSPFNGLAAESAIGFAEAVVQTAHKLSVVYFYHDGVMHVGESSADVRQQSLNARWRRLAEQNGCRLLLCQAAGKRRGLDAVALPADFSWAGLTQFFALIDEQTRLLRFGRCGGGGR